MSGIKSLFKSRKFWIAIAGIISILLSENFGMNEEATKNLSEAIIVIVGVLIAAIAVEDGASKLKGE